MADGLKGTARLARATRVTWQGLRWAALNEEAFRLELFAAIVLLPAAFWLGETPVERVLLAGAVLLVLLVEILNCSIEATVDRIGLERHELSGRAKDMGSAAVFIALLNALVTWILLLAF